MLEATKSRLFLERRLAFKLAHLDDVLDRGLLAGTVERRQGKKLVRELRAILFELRGIDLGLRSELSKGEEAADAAP